MENRTQIDFKVQSSLKLIRTFFLLIRTFIAMFACCLTICQGKSPEETPFIGDKPIVAILGTLALNISVPDKRRAVQEWAARHYVSGSAPFPSQVSLNLQSVRCR